MFESPKRHHSFQWVSQKYSSRTFRRFCLRNASGTPLDGSIAATSAAWRGEVEAALAGIYLSPDRCALLFRAVEQRPLGCGRVLIRRHDPAVVGEPDAGRFECLPNQFLC